jgi:carbon starvation protein
VYYDTWAHAGANQAAAFVLGGGAFLEVLGLSPELSRTLMAVLVISFAATTLDTATRIQRFILAEMGEAVSFAPLQNPYVATLVAIAPAALLAFWEIPDPDTGAAREAGWVLWPIFGASNQMLAALTLMVLSLYFHARKRPVWALVVPMLFTTAVTFLAIAAKLREFWDAGNVPMTLFAAMLMALTVWMLVEGAAAYRKLSERRRRGPDQ